MKKPRKSTSDLKRGRHWAVVVVMDEAHKRGLAAKGWEPYSALIWSKAQIRIPPGTLKYWFAGYSEPKVSELEAMAEVLGMELELLQQAG